jgi:hypothetical protein
VDGDVHEGSIENPDAVVESDPAGFFRFVVDRNVDCITVEGDARAVHSLLDTLPYRDVRAAAATAPT